MTINNAQGGASYSIIKENFAFTCTFSSPNPTPNG